MSTLIVNQAGPMTSVQDLGRTGLVQMGVSASGPMDGVAMLIANRLVGNAKDDALIEFASVGGQFEVDEPVLFAVTGGAVSVTVDGERVDCWASHKLLPGQTLRIGALTNAVWGYLALSGGIQTEPVLGARSTHLRSGIGGLDGRRLEPGDSLPLGGTPDSALAVPQRVLCTPLHRSAGPIRVIKGPQAEHFDTVAWQQFLRGPFVVSGSRDRMAQFLDGQQIVAAGGHDILSDGTVMGSIQVPASGRPIILMAERQTTGGYPKIATVASIDLPRLAQAVTGSLIRFRLVTQEQAEDLWIAESRSMDEILSSLDQATGAADV
ncbi:biotin-dependent carboxyltransferase family protein [Agrobacterium vaccinii]|uniref:5-oxoprolinase subunit C family protein n=1 Tax=Agrobacterium vaccinii TaxID=2735528 RepID=UPI001E6418B0|nr:biotin-dependent carboxyltransferase family protein [Agrobacterium vaccinii]UHS58366.1 biotin-dependent carboxyltransferase family protein [Agrobacterium vaccinii]